MGSIFYEVTTIAGSKDEYNQSIVFRDQDTENGVVDDSLLVDDPVVELSSYYL